MANDIHAKTAQERELEEIRQKAYEEGFKSLSSTELMIYQHGETLQAIQSVRRAVEENCIGTVRRKPRDDSGEPRKRKGGTGAVVGAGAGLGGLLTGAAWLAEKFIGKH